MMKKKLLLPLLLSLLKVCQGVDDIAPAAAPAVGAAAAPAASPVASYYDDDMIGTPADKSSYIVTKFTSFLSLMGSVAIILEVIAERRINANYPRRSGASPSIGLILVSTSISDIIFSTTFFIGNWAVPKDAPYMWNALGSTQTCTAQGFFVQLAWTATPCFSLALSVYFLLIVRYNWTQQQLKKLDPYVHGGIWLMALIMATVPLFYDMYNDTFGICWVEPAPLYCSTSDDDWLPCERGIKAKQVSFFYTIFPHWVCLFGSTGIMFMLWRTLRQMESKAMNRTFVGSSSSANNEGSSHNPRHQTAPAIQLNTMSRKRSIMFGKQAMLFLGVFYLVYVPELIAYLLLKLSDDDLWHFWYDYFVYAVMLPLLGFLNFIVFCSRKEEMNTRYGKILRKVVCCFGMLRKSTKPGSSSSKTVDSSKARSSATKDSTTLNGDVKPAENGNESETPVEDSFSSNQPPLQEVLPVVAEDDPAVPEAEEFDQEAGHTP